MKIIIAPDSFKESMSAEQAALAIEQGFKDIFPQAEYIRLPIADGGEGTVDALVAAMNGKHIYLDVMGPLGEKVNAVYGLVDNQRTAVIEMAAASGLMLIPVEKRDPLLTTSFGTGELIKDALNAGVEQIILAVGGSATVDGGMGMMQALGAKFYDKNKHELGFGGQFLHSIDSIDLSQLDPRINAIKMDVACDVDNPLIGPRGAAYVFGPQKGASALVVEQLEQGMKQYAKVIERTTGIDYQYMAGGGAAGGISVAAAAFMHAKLKPGIDIVIQAVALEKALEDADLVIVGEGSIDGQSAAGKAPVGVAHAAKRQGVPVVALGGVLGADSHILYKEGIDALFSILPRLSSLDNALIEGPDNLRQCARQVAQVLFIGQTLGVK